MVFDRFSDLVSFLKPHASYFQDVRPIGTAAPSPSYPKAAGGHNQTGEVELDAARPPYTHVSRAGGPFRRFCRLIQSFKAMLAGGLGGTSGDLFMHSLDTVKTRQQGDPRTPPRYRSLGNTYYTIWRLEGIRRGLYSGLAPALAGSFSGTVVFFGTYEYFKRQFIDSGYNPSLSYLAAGGCR